MDFTISSDNDSVETVVSNGEILGSRPTVSVRAYRSACRSKPDFYPTPAFVTLELLRSVPFAETDLSALTCLEPACGEGHMSSVLMQHFESVTSSDAHAYGYAEVQDFLASSYGNAQFDCVITNPPFKLSEAFVLEALRVSGRFVAILARTSFLEGRRRHRNIFTRQPPTFVLQFRSRISFEEGKISEKRNGATAYAWFIWDKSAKSSMPSILWSNE